MKQSRIIKFKLWDAFTNKVDAIFPVEFYKLDEIEQAMPFDKNHVSVTISEGVTDKGFDAYIVSAKRIIDNRNTK